ncbi:hypothetical protein GCM10009836_49890 [Pseudonocardia ailaonensis]|uniref:Cytochrome P450 n=1 Tax=Pseudonocardia ailaonensis TaxID=367279 RepID=A0ABN2NCV2_9PSEU
MSAAATCPFDHHALGDEVSIRRSYDRLRAEGVVRSPEHGGFYVLSRHADVMAALRDPATFVSGRGTRIPAIGEDKAIPLDYDPPRHSGYRALFTDRISPETVRDMTPGLTALVGELLDAFLARGGGEWVAEVGLALPLKVLEHLVGFSAETVSRFRVITEESWRDIASMPLDEARSGMRELVRQEVARHRGTRPQDYITQLLDREIDGRPITDDEIERTLMTFAIAGHETTMNASGWLLHLYAGDPRSQARIRADPSLIPQYVEEALRFGTPVQTLGRYTTRDVDVDGVTIPAGSRVLLVYAAANHDPARFDHADEFDVDRSAAGHLTFGFGRHQCAGALLARTELRLLLEKLVTLPAIVPAGEADLGGLMGGTHHGPRSLPLRFATDPAEGARDPHREEATPTLVRSSSTTEVLELDLDRCSGYGNCVFAAPALFDLDLGSNVAVLVKDTWDEGERAAVAAAVGDCPAHALRLRDREHRA